MITVKTIPIMNDKMFIFGNTIFISNGLLCSLSDGELQTSVYHELGHNNQLKLMTVVVLSIAIMFTILFLFIPIMYIPFALLFFYLVCCYVCRAAEYSADRYALKHSSYNDMKQFISNLNHDIHWIFYPFRYHPSNKLRLLHLYFYYVKSFHVLEFSQNSIN